MSELTLLFCPYTGFRKKEKKTKEREKNGWDRRVKERGVGERKRDLHSRGKRSVKAFKYRRSLNGYNLAL